MVRWCEQGSKSGEPPQRNIKHCKDIVRLCRDVAAAEAAVRGLMEIAELALPDSFFQSDSRVKAARAVLGKD
jgi:hypothetical protein